MRPLATAFVTLLPALVALSCNSCNSSGSGGGHVNDASIAAAPEQKPPEVAAWVLPYEDSLKSLERNAAWLTIVSPTYWRLAVTGKAARLEDWDPAAAFPRARLEPIKARSSFVVLPLVGCIGACGPLISRVLDDDTARAAHVADLVRVVREQNLAGLFIDYEDVNASEVNVTRFVDELSTKLHALGKKLALVVQEPCGADPACKRTPYPFALRTLADKVDHLAIMEYDFSVDGSSPPAPLDWVSRGLSKVVADVGEGPARRKVLGAIPLYGRLTAGIADDTAVLFAEVQPGKVRNATVTLGKLTMDPASLSKKATVTAGAKSGTLYLEDHETLAARLALASRYKLGGVALWRLGSEDPCVGRELAKYRRMPAPACN